MQATPAKLRNGSWGARVKNSAVRAGDTITITAKSGKSWQARVTRVLWKGDGVALCATESLNQGYSHGFAEFCGGICPVGGFRCSPKNGPCHDCL